MGDRSVVVISAKAKKGATFHLASCAIAKKLKETKRTTLGKAKKDGYVACGQCKPK